MNYTNYIPSHVYVVKLKGLQWTGHVRTVWIPRKMLPHTVCGKIRKEDGYWA
jgi:hypothetical protein